MKLASELSQWCKEYAKAVIP